MKKLYMHHVNLWSIDGWLLHKAIRYKFVHSRRSIVMCVFVVHGNAPPAKRKSVHASCILSLSLSFVLLFPNSLSLSTFPFLLLCHFPLPFTFIF